MSELAASWYRVSGDAQDEANQIKRVSGHIAGQYEDSGISYRVHADSAYKGEHVAELERAINEMAAGKYTVLVARHSDRVDREDRLNEWLMLAAAAGGRIEFVDEPNLRLSSDLGDKINVLVASHNNNEYSKKLARNVRDAHESRKARGALVGKIGWGYDSVCTIDGAIQCPNKQHDKKPVPNDAGRAYVKEIYVRSIGGQSLAKLAAWITEETGQVITYAGIRQILTSPLYVGRHTYADGTVLECEALVTADMQEQAGKALRSRIRRGQRGSVTTPPAMLVPDCLDCGRKAYRSGVGGHAYYCRTCRRQVQAAKLDSIVYGAVMLMASEEDETRLTWVEGSDSASERAKVKAAMRALDPEDDDYLDKAKALRDALKALPEAVPGHFAEQPTGRSRAEAIAEAKDDPAAMREMLATWGVAFARDGDHVRVKINGAPEFRRSLKDDEGV